MMVHGLVGTVFNIGREETQLKQKEREERITSLRASKATIQNNFKKCLEKTTGWKEGHHKSGCGCGGAMAL